MTQHPNLPARAPSDPLPGSAYACLDEDMQCAFIPSSGKIPGAAGCCKGKDCSFRISCIERSDMDNCDDDCKDNPLTLKW